MDAWTMAGFVLAVTLAVGLGWYLRGREERKRRGGVYVIWGTPLDDPGIDIPRPEDARRFPC
jgi:hypothetical protein